MMDNTQFIDLLYSQYSQEVKLYLCKKYYISDTEAEDFVQLTYSRLSKVELLEEIDNIRAYIYRTANNLVIDQLRQQERHDRWIKDETDYAEYEDRSLQDPARIQSAKQDLEIVRKAILNLPPKRRSFLKLSRYDNLSNVEIAKKEGISEAAVRKHIAKALLEIKQSLDESHSVENEI